MSKKDLKAENYFSKDFSWDQLREEVENDPSLKFHWDPYSSKVIANQIEDVQQNSDAWDKFHACHSTGKFFKERRYLLKEFPELASCKENSKILEVGCGNGSTALPILCGNKSIILYACDCSNQSLGRAKEIVGAADSVSSNHRFHPFLWDFTTRFPSWLVCNSCCENFFPTHQLRLSESTSSIPLGASCCNFLSLESSQGTNNFNETNTLRPFFCRESQCCIGGVDFITLIFTLSSVPVDTMPTAIAHCFAVLKPGGLLLFRDYGLYDMTMLRFKLEQRIRYREYRRSDGTRSYFFCLDTVQNLASTAGFIEVSVSACACNTVICN